MFTFTLPTNPSLLSAAANQTYALPTLLATPQSTTPKPDWGALDDSGLMVGPGSGYGKKKVARVRRSKFYKHVYLGLFGDLREPYIIERKDGRFYFINLTPAKTRKLVDASFYKEFRNWIKIGEWIETTPEKELAAN